jgi:hypothetical protein
VEQFGNFSANLDRLADFYCFLQMRTRSEQGVPPAMTLPFEVTCQ